MMKPKASFDLKMDRAEQHLRDLEAGLTAYSNRHPYEVRRRREGKRNVYRFHITEQPDPMLGLVAADFVYNVRSGLDHLAAALVPSKDRRSVMFPIFFEGVWGPAKDGDNEQRLKDRERWQTVTRRMHPDAVAILKGLQPEDLRRHPAESLPGIIALNRLSNTDRHTKLPVTATGLRDPRGTAVGPAGTAVAERFSDREGLQDGAELQVPKDTVKVEVQGTAVVLVRVAEPDGYVLIPDAFKGLLGDTRRVIDALRPFLH
jgi:hypothetical protein